MMIDKSYFELFDIPVNLQVDASALKKIFFTKSREFHPDYFTQSSQDEQDHALAMTSLINKAYTTLLDPNRRLAYFLEEKGVNITGNAQALPQMFLFEMMELNESIEVSKTPESKQKASQSIKDLDTQFVKDVEHLINSDDLSEINAEDLELLKLYHLKSKYLIRLQETLDRTT